jgi:hypothetical protein
MSSSFRRPSPATVIAIAALVVATSGVAIGSFAPKNGKIVACYSKKTGALRLVEEGKKCRRGEQKVAWNQQGKRGQRGPRGPAGDDGFDGLDGFDGFDGADGADAASMLTGAFTTAPAAEPVFAAVSGTDVASTQESEHVTLSPAVPTIARDLAVALDPGAPDPGPSQLIVTLVADGTATELSCTMSGDQRWCDSGSAIDELSARSRLTLMHTQSGAPASGPLTFRFGWRATTP